MVSGMAVEDRRHGVLLFLGYKQPFVCHLDKDQDDVATLLPSPFGFPVPLHVNQGY